MKNKGQAVVSDQIEEGVKINEFHKIENKRYQDYAVSKFEQIYRQNRVRLGLEVAA